ncbi:hypothetical protein BASA81_012104 [Batrachochytrium salamandrivorans]|nr:hypothetical protein BASA81_012104 [Batrachochytrium salamandrivorans]
MMLTKRALPPARRWLSSNEPTVWNEAKNRQGRVYYVNQTTKEKSWQFPPSSHTIVYLPTKLAQAYEARKNASEQVYDFFVNSTNAYYGVFLLCCAGLAYRIAFPPVPAAPSIGPVKDAQ